MRKTRHIGSGLALALLVGCGGDTPSPMASTAQPREPAEAPEPEAPPAVDCPGLNTTSARSGPGPSLVGEDFVTDLGALEAALPEAIGPLRRTRLFSNRRGTAGMASPNANANYETPNGDIGVSIGDLVHVCHCRPGMGARMRDRRVAANPSTTPHDVAGHPATRATVETTSGVEVWVADRCHVSVGGSVAAEVQAVAAGLDYVALARACAPP